MLTTIKSIYGRVCVLVASAMWGAYLGQQVISPLTIFLPFKIGQTLRFAIPALLAIAIFIYGWPKTSYLNENNLVNGKKATFGIFSLTLALIAFPGTLVIPFAYAAWSGNANISMYAWYSLIGVPVFILFSISGLALTVSARPKLGK
jgi:hypothetical protein